MNNSPKTQAAMSKSFDKEAVVTERTPEPEVRASAANLLVEMQAVGGLVACSEEEQEINEKTRGAATQIESPMLRNVREEEEISNRGAVPRNHPVVQEHRGRNLIRHTREHVQIKVKELNLDLHSVNTSRIQLIKTNSSKPVSF